ncbi:hypothetical protein CJ030_MR2G012846 [Morella rubra]|uniref:Reverse transcriptase zinc-binding domain-containing protein n=1 Tax=Morella rubra TaxID=262757 RepID=A0A6A1W7K9_9ROSI|nr:hypothetical protein CJ030_MR2G012846 [Morella rubra]
MWILDPKGAVSVKGAYNFITLTQHRTPPPDSLSPAEWKAIWKLKIQQRHKLMLWKVAADALPLWGKMSRWTERWDKGSWCPLCNCSAEFREHIFLACPGSKFLWRSGLWPLNIEQFAQCHY